MKPDILVFCILATIFSSSARHVSGFLTAQAAAVAAARATSATQPKQQHLQRHIRSSPSLYAGPDYLNAIGGSEGVIGAGLNEGGSTAIQASPRAALDSERAVYDPGDELLRALNAELAANGQELGTSPEEPDYADTVYNELEVASKHDMLKKLESDLREEQELVDKSALLMKMLEDPSIDTLPLVYVEEAPLVEDFNGLDYGSNSLAANGISKRSRYYRRYPWKRHTRNRGNYEPELRYACTPSKEDIFKLLVNLHENRKGNHSKTVNFCNRKRPAKAVFTNIRFLG